MKTPKVLDLFIRLVMYKEKLTIPFIMEHLSISERSLYYYIGNINEVIRIELGLEIIVRDGIVKCIKFE